MTPHFKDSTLQKDQNLDLKRLRLNLAFLLAPKMMGCVPPPPLPLAFAICQELVVWWGGKTPVPSFQFNEGGVSGAEPAVSQLVWAPSFIHTNYNIVIIFLFLSLFLFIFLELEPLCPRWMSLETNHLFPIRTPSGVYRVPEFQ